MQTTMLLELNRVADYVAEEKFVEDNSN